MEHPAEASEVLSADTVAGAFARRKELLNKEGLNSWEQIQKQTYCVGIPTTEARAIDKITALQLFNKQFPDRQELKATLASAAASLTLQYRRKPLLRLKSSSEPAVEEDEIVNIVVHRLKSRDWVEPMNGHFIPPCFPWAQILDAELQWQNEQQAKEEAASQGDVTDIQAKSTAGAIAQVLGRTA